MWTHLAGAGFGEQAKRNHDCDDVCEYDRERQPGHTGEFGDLDKRPVAMQRHAETVPAETAEEPSTNPFVRNPRAGGEKCDQQISN